MEDQEQGGEGGKQVESLPLKTGDSTDEEEDQSPSTEKVKETGDDDEEKREAKATEAMEVDDEDDVVRKPRRARQQALSDSDDEERVTKMFNRSKAKALVDSDEDDEAAVKKPAAEQEVKGSRLRKVADDSDEGGEKEMEENGDGDEDSPVKKPQRRSRLARASDDDSGNEQAVSQADDEGGDDMEQEESEAQRPKSKKEQMAELALLAQKRKEAQGGESEGEEEDEQPIGKKRKSRTEAKRDAEKEKEKARRKKEKERKKKEKERKKKSKKKSKKKRAPKEPTPLLNVEDLITQQLEKIISKAVETGDTNLTLRVCREQIAALFGDEIVATQKKFIKEEVTRIITSCNEMSKEEVKEMAASCKAVTEEEIDQLKNPPPLEEEEGSEEEEEEESDSDEAPGEEEVSDEDLPVKKSKKGRKDAPRSSGLFHGLVVVCAGKLASDPTAFEEFKALVEEHGGKVQGRLTAKVNYLVIANSQKTIASRDSKVLGAKKHGARIVLDNFFTESVSEKVLQSPSDFAAGLGEASSGRGGRGEDDDEEELGDNNGEEGSARKKKKKKARKERREGEEGGEGEEGEESLSKPKSRRRVHAKKSAEENEWESEFRSRFGYRKEARSKPFDPKDPVVPEATFYQGPDGVTYNAYLTQTEAAEAEAEEEGGVTKFYAFKLVEAGGFMKGEKWHLVAQWGKVGAQKPGCDVTDYTDLKEAKEAFNSKFWEKTRNSWEAGAFAFRTVSGKYSLVELSEDEGEEDEGEEEMQSELLDASIQRVVQALMGKEPMTEAISALCVDAERMPLRKLKRYKVNEALAELSSIQALLQKGDKKSAKDIQKIAAHTERIKTILPPSASKDAPIESFSALKERAAMLEDLGEVCVASALRKRAILAPPKEDAAPHAPSPSKLDSLYDALQAHLAPLPESGETFSTIRAMLQGAQAPDQGTSSFKLRLDRVFAVNRAGDDMRFAPFKRLPNRTMLWRGGRPSAVASTLRFGLRVPLQEAPSAGYIFGKGIYLHDCVTEAVARSHLADSNGEGWLLLCEAALGNIKETTRPSAMRRAPHGFHSVLGRGKQASNPKETVEISTVPEGSELIKAVAAPPSAAHGAAESPVTHNQYVVYDVSQVRPRYLVQVSLEFVDDTVAMQTA